MSDVLELYEKEKPDVVISHDCPDSVKLDIMKHDGIIKSRTGLLLQMMYEIHSPDLWVFGHHHKSCKSRIHGTNFVCLNELETITI
jgi:predicted phosphodiesterase